MKTVNKLFKQDKEKYNVPKSVQDIIPIKKIYEDGIFLVGKGKYSKCYSFADINYAVASSDDKTDMFLKYAGILNSLDTGATTKISIFNRKLNEIDFEKNVMIPITNEEIDYLSEEYNEMLKKKVKDSNGMIQEKFITVSINKKSVEEARNYFSRIGAELTKQFRNELKSQCRELSTSDRLRIFHNFYREGEETSFYFDFKDLLQKGHSFKDFICPDTAEFKKDYFKIGNRYGRVLFLKDYANYIKDSMIAELTDINKTMLMSIDVSPVPMDEAIKEAENRKLGVETNIATYSRKQSANNNFFATIPFDLEVKRNEVTEILNDFISRDQRMFLSVLTLVHTANTKEELDSDTESIEATGRKYLCQLSKLTYQQLDGLNTVLPAGVEKLKILRTLTTESLAVFMPFRVQEINHTKGIYYGQNVISKNMIIADRRSLANGNSFILGVSGSGKSFTAKQEIVSTILRNKDVDVVIIDPESEFSRLVKTLGGEVIKISATSDNHINAMDINCNYSDESNPIPLKAEFILSLCELLITSNKNPLGAKERSIIDRCTSNVYRLYAQGNYQGIPPTLQDFREELLRQSEPEAKGIALAIELFTNGNLNTFAKQTNVDIKNRLVCYDILELGKQLLPIGMLVVLDSIFNRITANRQKGRQTFIFIDEIYLLFQYENSALFLQNLWKRVRKYGACCTGITQNVEDLLYSQTARLMLANSEFLVMLNQAPTDRQRLAELLNISETQLSYITNVGIGEGLIKVGSSLVPFKNEFPKDTKLYKLMTTKLDEV